MTSVNYIHEIKVTEFLLHPYFSPFEKNLVKTRREIENRAKFLKKFVKLSHEA